MGPSQSAHISNIPVEIWKLIALCYPHSYQLSITCQAFQIDQDVAKKAFIRTFTSYLATTSRLPNGWLHSIDDQPAMIRRSGERQWFRHGKTYRANDLPTMICPNGEQVWYDTDREEHRADDKPARIMADGTQIWYQHGHIHRDNDLPAIIRPSGIQAWYQNGKKHRIDDKPAVIMDDGTPYYYLNNEQYWPTQN